MRRSLDYHGASARGTHDGSGGAGLQTGGGLPLGHCCRRCAMAGEPAMKTRTASAEFDRLFALAQTELEAGQGRRDHRLVLQRPEAVPVRVLRDRREVALRVDARSVVRGGPGVGEAGSGADEDVVAVQVGSRAYARHPGRRARWQRWSRRTRARAAVGRSAPTASCGSWRRGTCVKDDPAFRRRGLDVRSTTRCAQDDTLRLRHVDGPVSRRDLVPRLARAELPARGPRRTRRSSRESFALSTNVLHYRSAAPGRRMAAGENEDATARYAQQARRTARPRSTAISGTKSAACT